MEISRQCVNWETKGTGLYADPEMYKAKLQLDRIQAGDAFRNLISLMKNPDPIGGAMDMVGNAQAVASDMNALVQMNTCSSPGLKRFQENLRLFALNKQPIRLGAKAVVSSAITSAPGAPFKDQNYKKLIEDLIYEQSKSWAINQFVRVRDVWISSKDSQGRPSEAKAEYIYNGFSNESIGSVTLTFTEGIPECLYFFDFPNTCRSPNRKIVAAYANGAYQK